METPISEIRREYSKGKLTQCTIHDNPFEQFVEWLDDAIIHKEDEPTAMIVATVSAEGFPSTRTVLLKGVENNQFIFFTNYESRKGKQLAGNPYISLSFVWHRYTLKAKPKNAPIKFRILTLPPGHIKAR